MSCLSYSDFHNINKLLQISYKILDSFYKLRELELKNKKESEEFKKTKQELMRLLAEEEALYNNLDEDIIKLLNLISFLESAIKDYNFKIEDFIINLFVASNGNEELLAKQRICLKLSAKIKSIRKRSDEQNGINDGGFYRLVQIVNGVQEDEIGTILTLLNQYISDANYSNILEQLLGLKYNLAFLSQKVEQDFLAHDFSINPKVEWQVGLLANDQADVNLIKESRIEIGSKTLMYGVVRIIEQSKNDSLLNSNDFKILFAQIFMRAGLLFMGDVNVSNTLSELMRHKDLVSESKGLTTILKTYEMYEQDKNIPVILGENLNL